MGKSKTNISRKKLAMTIVSALLVIVLLGVTWALNVKQKDDGTCRTIGTNQVCTDEFINLSENDAIQRARDRGVFYRVVERDGKKLPITLDLSPDRFNFTVDDGKVEAVSFY